MHASSPSFRDIGWGDMAKKLVAWAAIASIAIQGCSSRPREFRPVLAAPAPDQARFLADYAACQQLYVAGKLDAHGRSGSAGAGAAAGAGTAVAGGATAAAIGGYGGLAAASATIVLLPFAVLGGAWGMSRIKRAKKEQAIKAAITGCLKERGYQDVGWVRAQKMSGTGAVPPAGK
jgi:hypothetical protein